MSENAGLTGDIPEHYDRGLGPVIFVDYAAEMARRAASGSVGHLLEVACGTGIVTRALRDALPAAARITATDLNADMLKVAEGKFTPDEALAFRTADGTALPFPDASFDTVVCQFGMMFWMRLRDRHQELGPVVNSPDLAESDLQHPASISHRLDGCWFRRASFFDS
jgi:SAM-dependent methyltransferase